MRTIFEDEVSCTHLKYQLPATNVLQSKGAAIYRTKRLSAFWSLNTSTYFFRLWL